jgi:hypothetical protein
MNAPYDQRQRTSSAAATNEIQSARFRRQSRTPHRERDFGVGYGESSGYASANRQRYAQSWAQRPFSCW